MKAELATAVPTSTSTSTWVTRSFLHPRSCTFRACPAGEVAVRGYPVVMVHADKIVTAVARGTVNTRWKDFAGIYLLSRHHSLAGADLADSVRQVARHRQVELVPLARVLDGYGEIGQARWAAWRRKQQLEDRVPDQFAEVVSAVVPFADPAVSSSFLCVHSTQAPGPTRHRGARRGASFVFSDFR